MNPTNINPVNTKKHMKIAVLAGGYSPERDVSLVSGSLITNALIENGHSVCLLDVYLGRRELPEELDELFITKGRFSHSVAEHVPDLEALKAESGNGEALIGPNVLQICAHADIVFLALHGSMGENGQLQATLDNYGIRYTGSGYVGSLLAMDKDLAKCLLANADIPVPHGVCVDACTADADTLIKQIGLPCVVKPAACGSSVGVSMPETREELITALQEALRWDERILVEEKIVGRELTVGILGGMPLPLVEILPKEGFYDYQNKYQGNTDEVCPAKVPESVAAEAQRLTKLGFSALRLDGYARFDFLLDRENRLYCLEANTLPGMTPTSLLPQAAAAVGIGYNALCERIIEISM